MRGQAVVANSNLVNTRADLARSVREWRSSDIRIYGMNDPETQNTLDSAVPKPEAAERLSEAEKKSMELGAQIEHAQGPELEELQDQVTKLDEEP